MFGQLLRRWRTKTAFRGRRETGDRRSRGLGLAILAVSVPLLLTACFHDMPGDDGPGGDTGQTDSNESLQAAVDQAAPGATVTLQGIYREDVRVEADGVTLQGEGGATLDGSLTVDADGVTLRDVTVTGDLETDQGTFTDLTFDGATVWGHEINRTLEACHAVTNPSESIGETLVGLWTIDVGPPPSFIDVDGGTIIDIDGGIHIDVDGGNFIDVPWVASFGCVAPGTYRESVQLEGAGLVSVLGAGETVIQGDLNVTHPIPAEARRELQRSFSVTGATTFAAESLALFPTEELLSELANPPAGASLRSAQAGDAECNWWGWTRSSVLRRSLDVLNGTGSFSDRKRVRNAEMTAMWIDEYDQSDTLIFWQQPDSAPAEAWQSLRVSSPQTVLDFLNGTGTARQAPRWTDARVTAMRADGSLTFRVYGRGEAMAMGVDGQQAGAWQLAELQTPDEVVALLNGQGASGVPVRDAQIASVPNFTIELGPGGQGGVRAQAPEDLRYFVFYRPGVPGQDPADWTWRTMDGPRDVQAFLNAEGAYQGRQSPAAFRLTSGPADGDDPYGHEMVLFHRGVCGADNSGTDDGDGAPGGWDVRPLVEGLRLHLNSERLPDHPSLTADVKLYLQSYLGSDVEGAFSERSQTLQPGWTPGKSLVGLWTSGTQGDTFLHINGGIIEPAQRFVAEVPTDRPMKFYVPSARAFGDEFFFHGDYSETNPPIPRAMAQSLRAAAAANPDEPILFAVAVDALGKVGGADSAVSTLPVVITTQDLPEAEWIDVRPPVWP